MTLACCVEHSQNGFLSVCPSASFILTDISPDGGWERERERGRESTHENEMMPTWSSCDSLCGQLKLPVDTT